ncbi:sporulation protein [Halioglobus maricola]|uniref:Sporulation protein n=1 Tax=Halioglobus maricola TaxID=2601894 RepID=A0A5P9NNS9_9GAMM|nr:SPOR domain-containing protein [Halioglobus maricola]QFU77523.1 sporulation protein [Halioglobus maricola]
MAQDFAKKKSAPRKKAPARKKQPAKKTGGGFASGIKWYGAGTFTGIFLSFLFYLGTLPPSSGPQTTGAESSAATEEQGPPKPRFDFYTMLPEQNIEEDMPAPPPTDTLAEANKPSEYYLLQAGSFRQQEDADRRRAQLLLLGLEPSIRESDGDNGRWFRVYLGPFETRSKMSKARGLTAAQNIDTLVLKRSG